MLPTSKLIVTKWLLLTLLLSAFFGAEAISQVPRGVTLETPVAMGVFRPLDGTVSFPGNFVVAETTDVAGDLLVADLKWVRVQIERTSDAKYWDGFEWVAQPNYVPTIVGDASWGLPSVDLSTSSSYFFRLSAMTNSGDFFSPKANGIYRVESIIDTTAPTGSLRYPFANRVFSNTEPRVEEFGNQIFPGLNHLDFRTSDVGVGSERLSAQVFRTSTGEYWSGFDWQADPIWIPTEGSFRSRVSLDPVDFSQTGTYIVRMNIVDFAGNVSKGIDNLKYEISVVPDQQAPIGILNTPTWEYFLNADGVRVDGFAGFQTIEQGSHEVRGRASDIGAGVSDVRIQVERIGGGAIRYWNGNAFQAVPKWNVATITEIEVSEFIENLQNIGSIASQVRWSIGDVDFDSSGQYVIRITVFDHEGNRSSSNDNRRSFILVE